MRRLTLLQSLSKSRSAVAVTLLATASFAATAVARAPQRSQSSTTGTPLAPPRTFPAPTNLKVLPQNLTGKQVHDIMEQWAHSLGVRCNSCHTEDLDAVGPDGRPRLKFADDSKPMKASARFMYTMTDEINANYIAKVKGFDMPVTCGTCHRGQVKPEPFPIEPLIEPPPAQDQPSGEQRPEPK
jgi:ABC-type amino acid transport substrate-binding protein